MVRPNRGCTSEKGTNVKSAEGKILPSDPESSISPDKSLERVKNEVQTIIDIMGPCTPNFETTSTSAMYADNEESIFTDTKTTAFEEELRNFKNKCKEGCPAPCNRRFIIEEEPSKETDRTVPPTDISLKEDTTTPKEDTRHLTIELEETPTLSDVNTESIYQPQQHMCPPPLLPANICVNSECMCPQVASYLKNGQFPVPFPPNYEPAPQPQREKSPIFTWLKKVAYNYSQRNMKEHSSPEYYKMDIKRCRNDDTSPPRRLVFELVDDCIKRKPSKEEKNFANEKLSGIKERETQYEHTVLTKPTVNMNVEKEVKDAPRTPNVSEKGKTRVDVYYFDHGNSAYFRTTDRAPIVTTEIVAEKTEAYTTKFWAEFFGTMHIGFSFVTSFILQLFRFLLYSIVRPLTIGLVQLASDYFFKPCLATLFNGVIQPPLIFLYNVATSLRDLCDPIAEGIGYFLREIAQIFKACRLVEVNRECHSERPCQREKCRSCNRKNGC